MALLFIAIFFLAAGCGRKKQPRDPAVARVGDRVITVSEFRSNYEFGMPFLKKGPDPKSAYLDYMIREKLLALEGYRLGFDRHPRVRENEAALMPELLIEELFDHEIRRKITVTTEEIHEGITKAKVSWKFRYWFEPNRADALAVRTAMEEAGYARVVAELLESNPEIRLEPADFESGYLTWLEIDPAILAAIKDLPVGEISEPLFINGAWVLFQITDIRREAFTENAFREGAESMRQVLFYRKAQTAVRRYVDSLMTPLDVRTKAESFRLLADALAEWTALEPAERGEVLAVAAKAGPEQPHLRKLNNHLDAPLTEFAGGRWTIGDFLQRFDPASIKAPAGDLHAFRKSINQRLALTLRDHYLAGEARKLKLHKSPRLQHSLQQWRDKWVYDEARSHFLRSVMVDSAATRTFFQQNLARYRLHKRKEPLFAEFGEEAKRDAWLQKAREMLNGEAAALQRRYPVTIHRAILDTIHVTAAADNKWMSVQLFKSGSQRMAAPIADPAWGL